MSQPEVLKLIALTFGGMAVLSGLGTAASLWFLQKKTKEKQAMRHNPSAAHGHSCP